MIRIESFLDGLSTLGAICIDRVIAIEGNTLEEGCVSPTGILFASSLIKKGLAGG